MKNLFIGIDFSKLKIDASFFKREKMDEFYHSQFENNKEGFKLMLSWIKEHSGIPSGQWLFCGEHTGLYSLALSEFLTEKGLFIWVDNPLRVKLSMGIQRAKNDKVDSEQLALYAYRFEDKARPYVIPGKGIKALQLLHAFRKRLIKVRTGISQAASEMRLVIKREPAAYFIYKKTMQEARRLDKEIKKVEGKMLEYIKQDPALFENYKLLISIKGIAFVNASMMIIYTGNFTRFTNPRQYACHVGVAPFGKTSGTSKNVSPRISKVANKELKALLTQAARCAATHDHSLHEYYKRKTAEGKDDRLVINNIRFKLIYRAFAVINRREPYRENYMIQN